MAERMHAQIYFPLVTEPLVAIRTLYIVARIEIRASEITNRRQEQRN